MRRMLVSNRAGPCNPSHVLIPSHGAMTAVYQLLLYCVISPEALSLQSQSGTGTGFQLHWNLEEVHPTGWMNLPPSVKASREKQSFLFPCPSCGLHQKMWPRFRVGHPASNNHIKKPLHRHVQKLEF